MQADTPDGHDTLLFGGNTDAHLMAVEHVGTRKGRDEMALFFLRDGRTVEEREPFRPFIVASINAIGDCPIPYVAQRLAGVGDLNVMAEFASWEECVKAKVWLNKATGMSSSVPSAPFLFINDPVQQHLVSTGRTLFKGTVFEEIRRMQVDIECMTGDGFEFCNADRESDRIIAIALSDQTGWVEVLSGAGTEEKRLLERFVEIVRERDPDVLEGHNIFNFDLPYLQRRAKFNKVRLAIGRDGSVPRVRPSRFSVGERTIAYERFEIFGRHVVDTLFMVHAYDISHRSLDGFGLKEVAVHFGLAPQDRTYIEGAKITQEFRKNPDRVMAYVRDDVAETRGVSSLLSRSYFVQVQMLPYSYQNVCVRGNATKIDSLMLREYLRRRHALPRPGMAREFEGGYTDMFVQGIVQNVHHCDVRSLYPSLMLSRAICPANDDLGVFLELLERLRGMRLAAREKMALAGSKAGKTYYDALQTTLKILINSFYGYLGFSQARFSDFDAAEKVTSGGRELLKNMIEWLRKHGAKPVEIDTDGIYFVPPEFGGKKGEDELGQFRQAFVKSLPVGSDLEFDGEYRSMFSYKMKNYALLAHDGEMVVKGAALKSRGLEPFQRSYLREVIRLKLEGRDGDVQALKDRCEKAIVDREWPIEMLAKTETLQDSPATYASKIGGDKRARSAVYELALKSGRDYRAGDQISYYVTGEKKSVQVHQSARLVSEWDHEKRDENVPYYLAKLEALHGKFGGSGEQGELALGGEQA